MPIKRWIQVGGAVACLSILCGAANAAPWIESGDSRARFALQKLADRGHLDRTVSTWPAMWPKGAGRVHSSINGDAAAVAGAVSYLQAAERQQFANGIKGSLTLAGASGAVLVQGFDAQTQDEGQLNATVEWQQGHWALGLSTTAVASPVDGKDNRYDGSYLAATFGNWVLGVGAIDRWWGPGWQSSLILSNNARPIPAVWFNRKHDLAPQSRWLSWIGPWNVTAFAGEYQDKRTIDNTKLVGMRLTLRPVQGLDIGFSRAIMVGGDGRPENASALWDAFIGRDNSQDGAKNDPGNQLGSIDIRYGYALGDQSMGVYVQGMGEDEANAFPSRKSWLLGTDWTTGLFDSDQQWYFEYSNTKADDLFGDARPNITYEHFQYRTGYRHHGRSMASSFDGDSETLTFGVHHFFSSGSDLSLTISYAELNVDGTVRGTRLDSQVQYLLPKGSQKVSIANVGYSADLFSGRISLNVQGADNPVELVGSELDEWTASASWQIRF